MPAQLLHISDFERDLDSAADTDPQRSKPARVYIFPAPQPPAAAAKRKRPARPRSLIVVLGMELLGMVLIAAIWALWRVVRL